MNAPGEERVSAESWLAEVGFADSRAHSATDIARLLEAYASMRLREVEEALEVPADYLIVSKTRWEERTKLADKLAQAEQRVAGLEAGLKTMLGWALWLDDCDSYYARKDDDGREFNADVAAAQAALTPPQPAPREQG